MSTQLNNRRNIKVEFGLLLLAVSTVFLGWTLVDLAFLKDVSNFSFPANFWLKFAGIFAILLLAQRVIRKFTPWADPLIFPIAVVLNGLGLVMIHRIDYALLAHGESSEVSEQLILSLAGIILMLLTIFFVKNPRNLRKFTYTSLIFGFIMLIMPLTPVLGREIYGARIWINIAGFSFQPAEIAKICFIIFFAGYLVQQRDNLALAGKKILGIQLPQMRHFAPILLAWLIGLAVLALEKDFGTALLFFGVFVAMLYVATERVSWLIIGALLSAGGIWVLLKAMPHIQARFAIWLNAFNDDVYNASFGSYQIVQGWFGMSSGGMLGTFLGEGYPTISFASNSDLIYASFGEELGFVGVSAILCLYLLLIFRAYKTGIILHDSFGKLLAAGIGTIIALQCFVIIGGVTRVIPLTGLALPFLALGGSALWANWILVGLMLRLSHQAYDPASSQLTSAITTAEMQELLAAHILEPEDETANLLATPENPIVERVSIQHANWDNASAQPVENTPLSTTSHSPSAANTTSAHPANHADAQVTEAVKL